MVSMAPLFMSIEPLVRPFDPCRVILLERFGSWWRAFSVSFTSDTKAGGSNGFERKGRVPILIPYPAKSFQCSPTSG